MKSISISVHDSCVRTQSDSTAQCRMKTKAGSILDAEIQVLTGSEGETGHIFKYNKAPNWFQTLLRSAVLSDILRSTLRSKIWFFFKAGYKMFHLLFKRRLKNLRNVFPSSISMFCHCFSVSVNMRCVYSHLHVPTSFAVV